MIRPRTDVPEIQDGLRSTLFRRMSSLVASGINGFAIVVLAVVRHPTPAFLSWAVIDSSLLVVRLTIVAVLIRMLARGGRAGRIGIVDAFIASSLVWSLQIGFGSGLCMASPDLVLSVFGALLSMGVVGASCARNPGAPLMTGIQMLLIIVPLSLGALMNANPAIRLVAVLAPAYLWGCMSISRQLHGDYIGMLTAEQKVRHVALHCSLTGLPNRASFNSLLGAALKDGSQHPVCVLFLDLDGFKSVNDTHGHLAGDRLLQQVAERLNRCTGSTSQASRLGGDEFAVLTRRLHQQDVQIMALRLIADISLPYRLPDEVCVEIGVSIGLSTHRGGATDPSLLLGQADKALYAAKRAGKGVCRPYDAGTEAVLDLLPGLV